jgi:starch synthase
MNIIFASSEVVPFSKTGGLGDVCGALPNEVAAQGNSVSVFTPYYRVVKKLEPRAKQVGQGAVAVGAEKVPYTLHASSKASGPAKVYFIACDTYFDRENLYGTPRGDYEDSCSRFVFFSRACLSAAEQLGQRVDVWHCHDWQTALIPVYLKFQTKDSPFHRGAASVYTIHNLAYQGLFWHWDWPLLNLPWQHFNWKELEFHGKMNLMKGALVHADMLTTVSPTYAQEIQTAAFGCGLEGVLKDRANETVGIVNGIDTVAWNPSHDVLLPAEYSAANLEGKRACKDVLRRKFDLPDNSSAVVGMIGRLFEQKGFDLVAQALEDLLRRDIQLVILGTGREEYQKLLQRMHESNPKKIAVAFAFDNGLAHLIEAGSDIFLMPSRYEPCGMNQLYSLAYGTPPVVHRVGGLADTVTDATPETLASGTATGFSFKDYAPPAMLDCLDRALKLYFNDTASWRKIQLAGMREDWSWKASGRKYVQVYERAAAKVQARLEGKKLFE